MWRRNERRRDGDDHGGLSGWMPVLVALPLLLFGVLGASVMMQREAARPVVGDIIHFLPGTPDRDVWRVAVPARVVGTPGAPERVCVLNSSVIAASGGSLIVEARLPGPPPQYRLHWAGPRSDAGPGDCGQQAEVVIGRLELRKLATAAGGFGVGKRRVPH